MWEVFHHRKVKKGYEIDHIDGDKTNDVVSNLQKLSSRENKLKEQFKDINQVNSYNNRRLFLWCPICGKRFKKKKCYINLKKLKKGKEFHFCCRKCQVKAQHLDYSSFEKQKHKRIKQKPFNYKNQFEDFKKFSKPIYIEKKVRVCSCSNKCCLKKKIQKCPCGNKIVDSKAKYCCNECREKFSSAFKVDKEKLLKYCKRSIKNFGRYNYSWIGRKLGVSNNAVKKNIIKYVRD